MKYRLEIDGLRALAVLPVIFFHADFHIFSGGFVGVDIFFVISGYLITSIIVGEQAAGKFSIVNFYERRARRILPALFFVMLFTLPASWTWMMAGELQDYGQSLVGVSLFSSNFLFWLESGYFDRAAELKPLLHTWSLAVEEQYYVFFPLLVMAFWRFGRPLFIALLVIISVLSLVLSEWLAKVDVTANFYLAPSRAWELLAGALVAMYLMKHQQPTGRVGAVGAAAGLIMVIGSIVLYDANTLFPGIMAIPPVLGTALIILCASPENLTGRLFSLKPLVSIGLISYSAYLWHQPLFAYLRLSSLNEPAVWQMLVLSLASLSLAWFSWRYVEKPFRTKESTSRLQIFTFAGFGTGVFILAGLLMVAGDGFPQRFGQDVEAYYAFSESRNPREKDCRKRFLNKPDPSALCRVGSDSVTPTVAIIGDSHAGAMVWALADVLAERGRGGVDMTYAQCPPLKDAVMARKDRDEAACRQFRDRLFDPEIAAGALPDTIILMARWTLMMERSRFNNTEGGVETGQAVAWTYPGVEDDAAYRQALSWDIQNSVAYFLGLGKRVVLVYPVPEVGWNVPEYLAKRAMKNRYQVTPMATDYRVFQQRNQSVYDTLDAIGSHERLIRVLPESVFCNLQQDKRCYAILDDKPQYFDDDHLSKPGADRLMQLVLQQLGGL